MRHLIALAAGFVLLTMPSRAQTVIWSESFESGLANWSTGNSPVGCGSGCLGFCSCAGNWQVLDPTTPCFGLVGNVPDGSHVAWFGISGNCNYDGGPGFASNDYLQLNTPVTLPTGAGTLTLRFWTKSTCETAGAYDLRTFGVSSPTLSVGLPPLSNSDWVEKDVDLTPMTGQAVTIRFDFNTVDDNDNAHPGWFIDALRIESTPEPGTRFCSGDGTATPCPCSVSGAPGRGCRSGFNPLGAGLSSSGSPHVSGDSIVLRASGVLFTSVLFFQGTTQVAAGQGAVFGDGLRCVGGSIVRLGPAAGDGGSARYPTAGAPSVSVKGGVPPSGGTRTYQAWYRDVQAYCTPSNFNLTNGLQLNWLP